MSLAEDPEPEQEPVSFDGADVDDDHAAAAHTGHERVDAAIERLRDLDDLPVDEHAAVYGAVHEELRASLTEAGMPADGSGNAS